MSGNGTPDHFDRLDELLCDHATCGLSESGVMELRQRSGGRLDQIALDTELAAAGAALALLPAREAAQSLPDSLRQKIESAARTRSPAPILVNSPVSAEVMVIRRTSWLGWAAAAAAMILAVLGWWPRLTAPRPIDPATLATQPGTASTQWSAWPSKPPAEDPESRAIEWANGVQGRVVWNAEKQEGFMYFSGMAPNDPLQKQYQLWIIDATQKHPIDGGVFDIPSNCGADEVVVRITPKIPVKQAAAFAVTIEKSGGVVVSDQHERVVVAALGK